MGDSLIMYISDCKICSQLGEIETAFYKYGWDDLTRSLPAAAGKLHPIEDTSSYDKENDHILRCPVCGVYYRYRCTYEYLVNGSEDDITLTRLTQTQVRELLEDGEYERLMIHHNQALQHQDAQTRSYAAKCLISHYLVQGDWATIDDLLSYSDRDVVYGALSFLASLTWDGALPPEATALRNTLARLSVDEDEVISQRAAYLQKYGLPGA